MLNRLQAARSSQLLGIPDGPEGVRVTLEVMRKLAKAGRINPDIRATATEIVAGLGQQDFSGEVNRLFQYVRDQIRYVQDPNDVERLSAPEITLSDGSGDCDDKAVLLASLLEAIGHPARFVAVAFSPDNFEHVYVETKIGSDWVPLETTEPVQMGWEPPGIVGKMLRHI
jgi:transglutaminase-like putative cysteine protease